MEEKVLEKLNGLGAQMIENQKQTEKILIEVESRLQKQMDRKLTEMEIRLQEQMDRKLAEMEIRLQEQIDRRLAEMQIRMQEQVDQKLAEIECNLQKQWQALETRVQNQINKMVAEFERMKMEIKKEIREENLQYLHVFEDEYGRKLTIAIEALTCQNDKERIQDDRLTSLERTVQMNTAYFYNHEDRIDELEKIHLESSV